MAEANVATVLTRLAPLIEKRVRAEVSLLLNANDEVKNLSSKLKKIKKVLGDAERKGVTDPQVKSWLDNLQDIAYDIDDAVDEWEVENIRQQYEQLDGSSESSDDLWQKVCSFLESVCLCFKQTVRRRSIALDVKNISERLDSIAQDNEKEFNFMPKRVGGVPRDIKPVETTSFVELSEILGRDPDKSVLMDKILSPSSNSGGASRSSRGEKDEIQIISIVGAGGMGKTTLAQLVFDEIKHKNEFKPIWVCVSDPFDGNKIAHTILNELGISYPSNSGFETLLNNIEKSISSKKIMLVLDDVWTEDDTMWKQLKKSLKSGASGSRILVTTRKERVAQVMGSTYNHPLGRLSDSDCWLVLSQIALYGRSESDHEMLKETGREIAKKCNGMPLAAKILGALLHSKTSLREWENVLKSEMWELEKVRTDVFPFLMLSYDELRPEEKRCFSYCAIFPKDYNIRVDELIRIWMSQGFLSSNDNMEQQGRDYFDRLAMCSFFQDFTRSVEVMDNRIIRCKMHDIVHDFAQSLTKNEILVVGRVDEGEKIVSGLNARHLSILEYKHYQTNTRFPKLRSLFFVDRDYMLGVLIPTNWFSNLKRLRLLTLRNDILENNPNEIGNLIHLRYLDISENKRLKELPESICDLYNLQTLNIENCSSLVGLPQGIDKLKNLRHLLNEGTSDEFVYPQSFEKLTSLRTLSVYTGELGYLKDLNQLQGSLKIIVSDILQLDAEKADLKSKKFIQQLHLVTRDCGLEISEALEPHRYLQSLNLFCCVQLPNWIGTLIYLKRLIVSGSRFIDKNVSTSLLPLQKLPFLEDLLIWLFTMEQVGHDFFGTNNETTSPAFPKLKKLCFMDCGEWKEWEDISSVEEENDYDAIISILPCLQELELHYCRKLKALPHRLLRKAPSLTKITIFRCNALKDRYDPNTGDDRDKLPGIQFVIRDRSQ